MPKEEDAARRCCVGLLPSSRPSAGGVHARNTRTKVTCIDASPLWHLRVVCR